MLSRIAPYLFVLLVARLLAQSLSGPVEGFLFDPPTQSFRAVNGFPGSATLGPPILSGFEYGSVAPHQNYGIAFKNGHGLVVSALDSPKAAAAAIPDLGDPPNGVAWSGDGSVAILYSHSASWIQTVDGLPKAPRVHAPVNLSILGGSLSAVGTDKAGKQTAVAMTGSAGGVYLNTAGQQFIPLAKMTNPMALAFSDDGAMLYVLESGAHQVEAIRISDWSTQVLPLNGLHDPFAIEPGHDSSGRSVLYVASRSDRTLAIYSLPAQKMTEKIRLFFQPAKLEDFGRDSFVLAPRLAASDPLWLLTTVPHPAVYFVPAGPAASRGDE